MSKPLRNPRHEAFARHYVETGNARRAYVEAGYNARLPASPHETGPVDACASRLLKHAKVDKRIAGIRQAMAKRADITEDSIADKLETAFNLAISEKQASGAVSAAVAQAKLAGLMIERKETGDVGDFARMTEQQLRDYIEDRTQSVEPAIKATNDGSETVQ